MQHNSKISTQKRARKHNCSFASHRQLQKSRENLRWILLRFRPAFRLVVIFPWFCADLVFGRGKYLIIQNMLQWMGGARRKVASTRKSMQNRQKQYFEQRRLQQQGADGGKYSEGNNVYGKHSENNRSLDVLSLQNLSKVAQVHKSTRGLASNEPEHEALNHQSVPPLQTFGSLQTNKIKSPVPSAIEETSSLSSYQPGNANTNMTSVRTPANHIRIFNSDSDKNQLKLGPEKGEICVIDILGDEDPNVCSCKSIEREAHASFSIEGLGEVEMETPVHTPVHSPEANCRTFLRGSSSPSKAMKAEYSFNLDSELVNLEFELDTMMQEVGVTLCKSSMDYSLGSEHRLGLFCEPKRGLSDAEEFSLFNESDNDFNDLLGDDELFFHRRKRTRHIWDAKSSFLPGKILDKSTFGLSHKNWVNQMDASTDYGSSMCHRKKEFTFQGSHRPKSRTPMNESGNFEPKDSHAPSLKHQKPQTFHNFTLPDMTCGRYSPAWSNYDVGDVVDQLMQPRHTIEDTRDNMSLLSEESCSSSAVKGVSKKGTLNSKEKQTFKSVDVACAEEFCSEYNMPGWKENLNKWKTAQAGDNITGQGKFTRTSNPLRSKPAHNSNTTSEKRLKPDNGRLFETAFDLHKASSGHDSYLQKSETTEPSSRNSKLWIEDPLDASEDPGTFASGLYFEKFSKLSADCLPCCNLKSEKCDFYQPNLKNSMLMSSMLNLSEDCNVGYRQLKSLREESCLASEEQSSTRGADENFDLCTTEHEKCEPEGDTSNCRKSLSSKNGYSRDAANKDQCSDCQEFIDGPAKVEGVKDMNSLEHAEETSTMAETSGIIDGNQCHVDETSKLDAQTSLSCQTGVEAKLEAERFQPEQSKMEGKGKNSVDSRCQVMMLDSYVLQFLCIQVLNEASAKVTGKQFDS